MITIPIRTCGDHWINVDEVKLQLHTTNGVDDIELDFFCEGGSLEALGITPVVLNHCEQQKISPEKIVIANWPNSVEHIPFQRKYTPLMSHFFWFSERYWDDIIPSTHEYRFGYFVGRRTPSRATMLYELYHQYPNDFLLSVMGQLPPMPWDTVPQGNYVEKLDHWVAPSDQEQFAHWWRNCPVVSIDGRFVNDQYDPKFNTNQSLVSHYNRFDIELVAETFTLGNTFFPTEKTIRPLMAAKPMLVYGPKFYLKRLQNLGFKTYRDFWDESYDLVEGPERWQRMRTVIADFMSQETVTQIEMVSAAHENALFNRQHLQKIVKQYRPT